MLHEPAAQSGPDASADYKAHIGVWMFLLYAAVYAAFVAINLLRPLWMEKIVIFGLNLAVVYGFGLIAFALVLAMIYNHMCGLHENDSKAAEGGK
ncbi:MAG: hypothetical protein A2234_01790 [Elusimicrobia bacterium RIFOXYA2_FULL_58_8]|nr:MAG: hypothetical protein A2234_01790 [Elusimicrobia bacterium RIFOXYA2_FULL_58_8]